MVRGIRRKLGALTVLLTLLLLPGSAAAAQTMVVRPDGKVVLGGSAYPGFGAIVRYLPDGSLDRGFGDQGILVDRRLGYFAALASRAGDGLLAAAVGPGSGDPQMAAYLADGSVDRGFGRHGLAAAPGGIEADPAAIVQRPDGTAVVAINHCCDKYLPSPPAAFARFGPTGGFEGTFPEPGGERPVRMQSVSDLAGLPDGSVVAVGTGREASASVTSQAVPALVRFGPDGGYDPLFRGGRGALLGDEAGHLGALALDTAGRILNGGGIGTSLSLTRYGADGILDTAFGSGGRSTIPVPGAVAVEGGDLAVQPDGRIVVTGTVLPFPSGLNSCSDCGGLIVVARFEADGRLDTSFGEDGMTMIGKGAGTAAGLRGAAVALLPDGRILVSGTAGDHGRPAFALARLTPAGLRDSAFGHGGVVITESCVGSERRLRASGCLPSAQVNLKVNGLAGPKPRLRLWVWPSLPWARIAGVRLWLPKQLQLEVPGPGKSPRGIEVRAGGRFGAELDIHRHSLGATHLGFVPSLAVGLSGGALRRAGEISAGRKLAFRVRVRFAGVGQPLGQQTVVLRRGG